MDFRTSGCFHVLLNATIFNMQQSEILKGAAIAAAINGVINGIINWFQVRDQDVILLVDDRISATSHTVLAGAVPLAASLAFILSSIAYASWKYSPKPPYWWSGFWLSLKHAIFAFGLMVLLGVLISRAVGEVYFSPWQSAVFAGLVAALTAGAVDVLTKLHIMRAPKS
jgi:hypothetical protein